MAYRWKNALGGHFECFAANEPCTVKLVYVDVDKRPSLQYHNNRSEFWKAVKGPVIVQIGEEKKLLRTGDTITIPKGTVHRLEGAGTDAIILETSRGEFGSRHCQNQR